MVKVPLLKRTIAAAPSAVFVEEMPCMGPGFGLLSKLLADSAIASLSPSGSGASET